MVLSRDHALYGVEGQGEIAFYFPDKLAPTDDFFKGIGTRSNSGLGTCTVYYDDVYVLRQPPASAGNMLLLDEWKFQWLLENSHKDVDKNAIHLSRMDTI